eukprot:jgi/Chlat1/4055/Chrsp26S04108
MAAAAAAGALVVPAAGAERSAAIRRRPSAVPTICQQLSPPRLTVKTKKQQNNDAQETATTTTTTTRRASRPRNTSNAGNSANQVWRVLGVEVPPAEDPGKDHVGIHDALRDAVASRLSCQADVLPLDAITVVRKSFDARKDECCFVYVVDINTGILSTSTRKRLRLRPQPGRLEPISGSTDEPADTDTTAAGPGPGSQRSAGGQDDDGVIIVGCGPAGLFAALSLAEAGVKVTLIERGAPVETRGRDIGALFARKLLNEDSNLCYGEGGAGTWSDGKLTTRIGKNSDEVRHVLATLVRFGAPSRILVDGKPHLGTDRLVRLLKAFRRHLVEDLGATLRFHTALEDLLVHNGRVVGVKVRDLQGGSEEEIKGQYVVLGVGHSARKVYDMLLHRHNVTITPKDFALGFRIEHPQEFINRVQYGVWAAEVPTGKLPVADYRLSASNILAQHTQQGSDGEGRGCYSFCMCPGGQVVPTSTSEDELCVNGMSFSRRASRWANAALVVTVSAADCVRYTGDTSALAGVQFQRLIEREAAIRGGGKFVAPVQRVTDFMDGIVSGGELPSSSYRLGVKEDALHTLYPADITEALREALRRFERAMPGYVSGGAGLLHGVETRTSAPVRVERDPHTLQSPSLQGLFPTGEGAGYAGGIVSAAVDGARVGRAVVAAVRAG